MIHLILKLLLHLLDARVDILDLVLLQGHQPLLVVQFRLQLVYLLFFVVLDALHFLFHLLLTLVKILILVLETLESILQIQDVVEAFFVPSLVGYAHLQKL